MVLPSEQANRRRLKFKSVIPVLARESNLYRRGQDEERQRCQCAQLRLSALWERREHLRRLKRKLLKGWGQSFDARDAALGVAERYPCMDGGGRTGTMEKEKKSVIDYYTRVPCQCGVAVADTDKEILEVEAQISRAERDLRMKQGLLHQQCQGFRDATANYESAMQQYRLALFEPLWGR